MDETELNSFQIFPVHRIIGRYEIDGHIAMIPAPPPNMPKEAVDRVIEVRVLNMVRDEMVAQLLVNVRTPKTVRNRSSAVIRW